MLKSVRIIPRLDIKGPNLVKGVHLEGLRVLGKPWDYAMNYYNENADELIYIDAVASLYGRNNLHEIVRKTAENLFIPLIVGGGIRCEEDIYAILRTGADKVAINTAAVQRPNLIKEGAKAFGSQCIVGSVQARLINDVYRAYTDNAREPTGLDVFEWVKQLVDLGVGEILLTSIDMEGTGRGYDLELIAKVSESVPVPVIACGGCGNANHAVDVVLKGHADAVCAATVFHYKYLGDKLNNFDQEHYTDEGNIEFLKGSRGESRFLSSRITPLRINDVKDALVSNKICCRTN